MFLLGLRVVWWRTEVLINPGLGYVARVARVARDTGWPWCSQVHSTSKKLLYQLDHLVQICNQPGMEQLTRKHVCNILKKHCFYFLFSCSIDLNAKIKCHSIPILKGRFFEQTGGDFNRHKNVKLSHALFMRRNG